MTGLGWPGTIERLAFPADRKAIDIGDYYGDHSLVRGDLGWDPQVSLREGLERSLAFYREHRDRYWAPS
jgi:UDP-glucose 4-epimerase